MTSTSGNHVRATIVDNLPKPSWLCGPGEMFASWRLGARRWEKARRTRCVSGSVRRKRPGWMS
jgi:hypothetical protein